MANYSTLSNIIATHGDAAIFRRFTPLNVKNLLYMQAELIHLDAELRIIETEDRNSGDVEKTSFSSSFYDLKESAGTGNGLQWRKYLEVREKLRAYNSALLQFMDIQKLAQPMPRDIDFLREWLDRPEGGDFFLRGREADTWQVNSDFIKLCGQQSDMDALTRAIYNKIIPWYHSVWGHRVRPSKVREWDGVWVYDHAVLAAVANGISTMLASLLPASSILILYLLPKPATRLAVSVLFITLFSFVLTTVFTARRVDVFAATAA
ncbi:MAG: hypothetical protein LQ342_002219 [Letrouitia transgressa]|nr:MAG: hypothetical protein LQ342_002219 [Letrouitia transgressa]